MQITRYEAGKILSGAVRAGHLLFVSGTVPDDLDGNIENQTEQVLGKIDALLKKAGTHKSNVVSVSIWLTDIRNRDGMNKVWLGWMDPANPPARATVEAKLADPRMLVEIACVAVITADDDSKDSKDSKNSKNSKQTKKKSSDKKVKKTSKADKESKVAEVQKTDKDNLEVIEGVGPKIAALLVKSGIKTFKELAFAKPAAIEKILSSAGARFKLANPSTWPQQAALLSKGDQAAFAKLVAELRGGVVVTAE